MASASVSGTFNEANCPAGGVTVSATSITWLSVSVSGAVVPGCVATGALVTSPLHPLTYSGGTLGAGVYGSIQNLTAGGPSTVDNFMTFQGTTLDFVLTGFSTPTAPSNGTNCGSTISGQTCVVFPGSPFLLSNTGGTTTGVSLTAFGTITDSDGIASSWMGLFTTQLTNMTPGGVQAQILGGGSVTSTQSGQFDVTIVPEPASWSVIGAGLIALATLAMRRKSRA